MALHALRGAITVDADTVDQVVERSIELLSAVFTRNGLVEHDVLSIIFSATPDIVSMAPAAAARRFGLTEVPMLCTTEMPVDGSLPLCIRLLAHVDTEHERSDLRHVFLRGAVVLRPELAEPGDEHGFGGTTDNASPT